LAGIQAPQETGDITVTLTRDFKETIQARVQRDPVFREELLKEGIQCLLTGDMDVGKAILRDYIKATLGFEELGSLTDRSAKSLIRMFGPKGNPQARNLFEVIDQLQKKEGVQLQVHTVRKGRNRHSRSPQRGQRLASHAA
jgi:hypothetical protein